MNQPVTEPVTVVRAEGAGSIAVGRDAINSIFVTGGVNQFFVGQYERLADAYLNPSALYRELQLDDFVGRDWLAQEVDAFVASRDRGYLDIEAEAGMGKTAFMAWLARGRDYVHHFVRLMPDPDDIAPALRSLAAQLIRAWDLQERAVGGVLPPTASRPDFFENLLYEAARKRDATRPGEPIVLTVDGLNETTPRAGQNPLALPSDLPAGVYVVVSHRTVQVPLSVVAPRKIVQIRAGSNENLADMRAFLRHAAEGADLAGRLEAAGIAAEVFVEQLVERTKGVWLVLRYVLADLRSGARGADDLESLPVGLWQYYAQFWRGWQHAQTDHWADVDLPLLVMLTTVQEPATVEFLCTLAGIADTARAYELLGDPWRPFLQVSEGDAERFSPFHDSLGEFVAGEVDVESLASAERSLVRRLAEAQREAHARVAHRYLDAWGGLDAGLPALREDGTDIDGGYGFRHVVSHLARAGDDEALHRLMALEWDGRTNAWFEAHRREHAYAAYAVDVRRAWAKARDGALAFRYALVATSVNSVAGNIPARLLRLLVERRLITPAGAVALAREMPDARARAEALTTLAGVVAAEAREDVLRDALASVQIVPDGYWRAGELARLIPELGPHHDEDVGVCAASMRDERYRQIVLWLQARQSDPAAPAPARLDVTHPDPPNFLDQYRRRTGQALAALLAVRLQPAMGLGELLQDCRFVRDPRWRAEVLTTAYDRADPAERDEVLRAALDAAMTVGDLADGAPVLTAIAARLASAGRWAEALDLVVTIDEAGARAEGLFALAAVAPAAERDQAVGFALDAVASIPTPSGRARVLARYATALDLELPATSEPSPVGADQDDELRASTAAARAEAEPDLIDGIADPYWRMQAQATAAPAETDLPTWRAAGLVRSGDPSGAAGVADGQADAATRAAVWLRIAPEAPAGRDPLDEARHAIAAVDESDMQWRLDGVLAVALAQAGRIGEAIAVATGLSDERGPGVALLDIAAHVGGDSLGDALAAAETIPDAAGRAQVLARLTPAVLAADPANAPAHLRAVLDLLFEGTRRELLQAAPDLLPIAVATDGPDALAEIGAALTAVYRWWP